MKRLYIANLIPFKDAMSDVPIISIKTVRNKKGIKYNSKLFLFLVAQNTAISRDRTSKYKKIPKDILWNKTSVIQIFIKRII